MNAKITDLEYRTIRFVLDSGGVCHTELGAKLCAHTVERLVGRGLLTSALIEDEWLICATASGWHAAKAAEAA